MNNFVSEIPLDIYQATHLEYFNASYNPQLRGHIPMDLASIHVLGALDLSNNKLNGSIPAKFGSSSSLQLLNVFFNHISGSIPTGKSFKLMDSSAFVGNSELCGAPLRQCPDSDGTFENKGTWRLTCIVLLSVGLLIILLGLAFGIVYFRREVKTQWKMV
ncbi:hypothetical protein TanjilG_10791 [Lupinus angustifolius]|uniref:Leucine-rich repeat-containing N-terminal plant-type domain-containing protein n=1 Tax=Lupinus angustifolius TaxID=3871 RepID=A0A1J7GSI3_LUPAN|nr:hypothetical protein TanjilG_10791 [Lupinus angustifolius]